MVGFIDFAEQILTCTEPEGEFCEDITFLFLYLPVGGSNQKLCVRIIQP